MFDMMAVSVSLWILVVVGVCVLLIILGIILLSIKNRQIKQGIPAGEKSRVVPAQEQEFTPCTISQIYAHKEVGNVEERVEKIKEVIENFQSALPVTPSVQPPVAEKSEPVLSATEEEQQVRKMPALFVLRSQEMLEAVYVGLRRVGAAKTEEQKNNYLTDLQECIQNFKSDDYFDQYKVWLDTTCPQFVEKVQAAATEELSDFELRLCAYMAFDIASKEIAALSNKSLRTIETMIYKLRKKLNIPSEEKTSTFFSKMMYS